MSKLLQNQNFRFGIILGVSLFLAVQLFSFAIYAVSIYTFENPPGMNIDMYWAFGLPYPIFYGQLSSGSFSWRGILGNLLFAMVFSFTVGLIFRFIRGKLTAKKLE